MDMSEDEIEGLLLNNVRILNKSINGLKENIKALLLLGLDKSKLKYVVLRCPKILLIDLNVNFPLILNFLREYLELKKDDIVKILENEIELFTLEYEFELTDGVKYLEMNGISSPCIKSLIMNESNFFKRDTQKNITNIMRYFKYDYLYFLIYNLVNNRDEIDMDEYEFSKMFQKSMHIYKLSIKHHIKPYIDDLLINKGLNKKEIVKHLCNHGFENTY